jgi:GTP diphosphokinase / guanosine-3',5'-bis(diphosphate) 3'-diphosphatase
LFDDLRDNRIRKGLRLEQERIGFKWVETALADVPLDRQINHGNPARHRRPIIKASAFAAAKHRNQRRKDAEASPYINHPIALADVLANEGGIEDPTVLCAAILHDTIEDTETTPEELERHFGRHVAAIVLEVTDDKSLEKHVRKQLQIDHAPHISREAKLVKLADKICNLRDILDSPPADWSTRAQASLSRLGGPGHRGAERNPPWAGGRFSMPFAIGATSCATDRPRRGDRAWTRSIAAVIRSDGQAGGAR